MTETAKFEIEVSFGATVTVFNKAGEPVTWLRPGSSAKHTWYGMPTPEEVKLRYRDMVDIASAILEDGLVDAQNRALEDQK